MDKILKVTGTFNPDWARRLEQIVEGEIKDAVVSIVATRNKIAHGDSVGITYTKMKAYYRCAIKLVEFLEKQCDGECI